MEKYTIDGDEIMNIGSDDVLMMSLDGSENIQGFFSALKRVARKATKIARKVSRIPYVKSFLPPGTQFGISMLNKLASNPKANNIVRFSPKATKTVYANAFLRGRKAERKRILKKLSRM